MAYNPFLRQIKVIKKRHYAVVILRKNIFNKYNFKGVIKRFGNVFVTENGFKNELILPYNTENFIKKNLEIYLKNITANEPIIKNFNGELLPFLYEFLGQKKTVFIKTNNKQSFINLSKKSMDLYGVEPVFFEEKTLKNTESFYDLDAFLEKLSSPIITTEPHFQNCDPLQLKAALFECIDINK